MHYTEYLWWKTSQLRNRRRASGAAATLEVIRAHHFLIQADKLGDWFKWGSSPRAKIFDRDHHDVVDIDSLTKLMRYNDYTHDEFSRCKCNPPYSAEAGISARGDLNPANGTYEFPGQGHVNHGALDYKGTNSTMMKTLQFRSQGGPTWGNVPPFRWSNFDFVSLEYFQCVRVCMCVSFFSSCCF